MSLQSEKGILIVVKTKWCQNIASYVPGRILFVAAKSLMWTEIRMCNIHTNSQNNTYTNTICPKVQSILFIDKQLYWIWTPSVIFFHIIFKSICVSPITILFKPHLPLGSSESRFCTSTWRPEIAGSTVPTSSTVLTNRERAWPCLSLSSKSLPTPRSILLKEWYKMWVDWANVYSERLVFGYPSICVKGIRELVFKLFIYNYIISSWGSK